MGAQWSLVYNIPTHIVGASGNTIFIVNNAGFFRSIDNGARWLPADSGLGDNRWEVDCLAAGGANLFLGTTVGVYRSTNNGVSWTVVPSTGLSSSNVLCIAAAPNSTVWIVTDSVYHRANTGTRWFLATSGLPRPCVTVLPLLCHGNFVYGGVSGKGVWRSEAIGAGWVPRNSGLEDVWGYYTIQALVGYGTAILCATNDGIYRTADSGWTWTKSSTGMTSAEGCCFAVDGSTVFVGTHDRGVFQSVNGTQWSALNTGLTDMNVLTMASVPGALFVGTFTGLFRLLRATAIGGSEARTPGSRPLAAPAVSLGTRARGAFSALAAATESGVFMRVYTLSGRRGGKSADNASTALEVPRSAAGQGHP